MCCNRPRPSRVGPLPSSGASVAGQGRQSDERGSAHQRLPQRKTQRHPRNQPGCTCNPGTLVPIKHRGPLHEESSAPRRQLDGGVVLPAADGRGGGQTRRWQRGCPRSPCCGAVLVVARPDGVCPEERSAGSESSSVVAVVDPASSHATASVAGVQHAVSTHPVSGVRDLAVQPSGVRSPGVVVQRVRRSAVCCPPVRCPAVRCPPIRCPAVWCLPRPSGRVRILPPQRGGLATLTTGTGGGPGGCRAGDGSIDGPGGRDAGDAARVALVGGRSVADPGRRVGCGPRRPRLPAERPGRPGRRAERPSRRRRGGHGCRLQRGVAVPAAWLASRLGARPRWVVVAEADVRVGGPGGARGGAGGDGRAAPARPRPAVSVPGSLPAVL
jgi:hypothetical protein